MLQSLYTVLDTTFTPEEERAFIDEFPVRGVFNMVVLEDDSTVVGFQNVEPFARIEKPSIMSELSAPLLMVNIVVKALRSICLTQLLIVQT